MNKEMESPIPPPKEKSYKYLDFSPGETHLKQLTYKTQ